MVSFSGSMLVLLLTNPPAPLLGETMPAFALKDQTGKLYTAETVVGAKATIVAFLGIECPLVKMYAHRLCALHERYESQGVQVIGVDSNRQDSLAEIEHFVKQQKITFPILKDVGNELADKLQASRTPEVLLFDADRKLRYRGRVDDQYGVGYVKDAVSKHYLNDALSSLLAGQSVTTESMTPVGCLIGRLKTPQANSEVTYSNQIARILQDRCVSCHRSGEVGPFSLTEYSEAVGWASMIQEVTTEGRMPPWHASPDHGKFRNENRLTDTEKTLITKWVATGAPEGDRSQLPPARDYTDGWQLPKQPDAVLAMGSKPFAVPATGEVRYQKFIVDTGFTEDKWTTAIEVQPGNRAVVHHILLFVLPADRSRQSVTDGADGFLAGYVPGLRVEPLPTGMAKRIPANSRILFQIHYTPNGTPQEDISRVGFVFADRPSLTHRVETTSAVTRFFRIPPQADNHPVTATSHRKLDGALLLSFMPHMHLRGKSFRYELASADQSKEILIDIPHYDFNWQTAYRLAEPRKLSAGDKIVCTAHYDNSPGNLNNPNPNQTVFWGDQTWEEMMIGYFDIAVPIDATEERTNLAQLTNAKIQELLKEPKLLLERLDSNHDQKISKEELPRQLAPMFGVIDRNADGFINLEELTEAIKRRPMNNN